MEEKIAGLVSRVKDHLTKEYGGKIKQVLLYGSHARSQANEDSDIDVLVVIDNTLDPFQVRKSLSDFLFDVLLDEGELISVIAVPENIFNNYGSPFLLNVKEEGIAA
ncbi:MAG: nucleotidyltransferase domain-containing protein [bacterium]|jgi:predicted nucleotidyltransferase|nr:nucleotidyltransferase domain-containing protein [bacterium]